MNDQVVDNALIPQPLVVSSLRDLDALVAQHIFGNEVKSAEWGHYRVTEDGGAFIPWYTTEMGAAWAIAEKFQLSVNPVRHASPSRWLVFKEPQKKLTFVGEDSAPLAICLSGMKCMGIEIKLYLPL